MSEEYENDNDFLNCMKVADPSGSLDKRWGLKTLKAAADFL